MKPTRSFEHMRRRPDRAAIKDEWVARAVNSPISEQVQTDGRIRRWAKIPEAGERYLRVILLEDGETGHNAFFDRSFREKPS
ncbi:MAG: hypothetical protein KGY99_08050 [Phycisphaerae bacterium]|nr:hypothetical protein [Phycisphaerae bacterium]